MLEHFVGKVAQKALIVDNGKVLITRDSQDTCWELPGGRLDKNEEPKAAMKRELQEELGIAVEVDKIFDIALMHHTRDDQMMLVVYYEVTLPEGTSFSPDPGEVAEMEWVGKDNFQQKEYFPAYARVLAHYFNMNL